MKKVKIPVAEIMNKNLKDRDIVLSCFMRGLEDSRKDMIRISRKCISESIDCNMDSVDKSNSNLVENRIMEIKQFKGNKYGRSSNGYKMERIFSEIDYRDIQFESIIEMISPELLDLLYSGEDNTKELLEGKFKKDEIIRLEYLDMILHYNKVRCDIELSGIIKEDLDRGFKYFLERVYGNLNNKEEVGFKFAGKLFFFHILLKKKIRTKNNPFGFMRKEINKLSNSQLKFSYFQELMELKEKTRDLEFNEFITNEERDQLQRFSQYFREGFYRIQCIEEAIKESRDVRFNSRRFLVIDWNWIQECKKKGLGDKAIVDELRLRVVRMGKEEEWDTNTKNIGRLIGCGLDRVYKSLASLSKAGIIVRYRKKSCLNYTYRLRLGFVNMLGERLEDLKKYSQRVKGVKISNNLHDRLKDSYLSINDFSVVDMGNYKVISKDQGYRLCDGIKNYKVKYRDGLKRKRIISSENIVKDINYNSYAEKRKLEYLRKCKI